MTTENVRVLVLEDDADDFLILKVMLSGLKSRQYELERATTSDQAMEKLTKGNYDVCLLDYRLEGKNGLDFLREANQKEISTPVIFLTGQGDYEVDVEAMRLGAADFLYKNRIDKAMVERSIRYAIERKKSAELLRRSEEFFRATLENALDGIAIIEAGGNIHYASPSVKSILGYEAWEKIQSFVFDLVHPEDAERVKKIFEKLLANPGLVLVEEFRARHKDGSWRILEASGKSHFFQNPDFQGIVVNYRDVTERKNAERATVRLAAIVESSNDAIFTVGFDGAILSWNPGAEKIYGFEAPEIGGRHINLIIPPKNRGDFNALLEKVRGGEAISHFAAVHQNKKGVELLVSLSLSPVKNTQGQATRVSIIARDVTESERAKVIKDILQAERDQLLERLQLQMEWMPIACVLTDEHFQFTYWNPAAERMFGFTFNEVEGKSAKETITPDKDDLGRIENSHEKIQEGKGGKQAEIWSHRRKDGTKVLCEWYYTPLKDGDGKLVGTMGMAIDVTERRKAEEARARLASILEQTEEAVIGADLRGNITDWNKGAEKMYGYRAEEVLGKPGSLLEWETQIGEIARGRESILKGKNTLFYETQRRKKNGQLIHVAVTLTAQKNDAGNVVGFSAIARDITEQKKAEEVQSQLAAILQQTPDAVIGCDLDGNVFSWNRGAEKMFGYSQEEIMGQPMTRLAPEERRHESDEMRDIAAGGESISNFETIRLKKSGEAIDVSITLSPIRDTRGRIVGVSSICRDISERKQAEESLRKHEEQMRLVEKMNAIGRLAGGVAHDFNNLLSVIGGNAEFLLGSLEKESSHRDEVEEIQKAVRRGAELTKQLLVFGQKQVVKPGPVNLNEMTAEMSKMLKRLLDATVELSILEDKNLKPILADSGQMQQVILNLVINARDAMPTGGHLILETRHLEEKDWEEEQRPTLPRGSYVRLAVTDSGTGMSPEIQKHIFEPFFTTKSGKGTGLGLASVYGIVTKWSGHIFVHSTPGMGTTFTLYFPAMVSAEGFEKKEKRTDLIQAGTETLLVVEDEDPVRKVLVRTLEKYGYKILEAPNGIEAVKKAWKFKKKIDLLLTDTVMPKMNGKELADELRKTRPGMKVLFISGYPKEILSQQGILAADIHLVQKPFELEDLGREIRKILDEK